MDDLGKIINATGFEKLPKAQLIAKSGHTDCDVVFVPVKCQFVNYENSRLTQSHLVR